MTRLKLRRFVVIAVSSIALATTRASGAEYSASFTSPPIREASPGGTITVPVTVTNTGSAAWGSSVVCAGRGGLFYLTYDLVDGVNGAVIAENMNPTFLWRPVLPGASTTVQMHVDVPAASGSYKLRWSMGSPAVPLWSKGEPQEVMFPVTAYLALLEQHLHLPEDFVDGPDEITPGNPKPYMIFGFFDFEWPIVGKSGIITLNGSFAHGPYAMQIVEWTPSKVRFNVPPEICGEIDQDASLDIVTPSGKTTSKLVSFVAKREERRLRQPDMTVVCSNEATRNRCNDAGDGPIYEGKNLGAHDEWAVTGQHQRFWTGDHGEDRFSVPLKNGWEISWLNVIHESVDDELFDPDTTFIAFPGDDLSATHTVDTVVVKWKVGNYPRAWMGYAGVVDVAGPCGLYP